nr:DNA topoisomerase I [uncultured bacterium]
MIIESPGKRKKLKQILDKLQPGVDWRIEASVGHIRDLPARGQEEGQIVTGVKADFTPVYELSDRGKEIVGKLKKLAKEAEEVYLATDPDREGESISWHLQQALSLKNPIRVSFNDINQAKVQAALAAKGKIDVQMVAAQEARRVLDRLVGYMVSPELRRQSGQPLSAGRVQSPAVYLVVIRERQIRAFVKVNYFGVRLIFADAKTGQWAAEWKTLPDFTSKESPYFLDKSIAAQVAAVKQVVVEHCEETEAKRSPPAPFTTSLLQQAASNSLRFEPKQTMDVAQKLYEQGHITYMRTDNPNIGEESMDDLRAVAAALGLEVVKERRTFKAKDGAQEGHPAITPSHWEVTEAGETPEEQALYKLIRLRAIASQLTDARYDVRKATLRAEDPVDGKPVRFEATGRTLTYKGWLELLEGDSADEPEEGEEGGEGVNANNPVPPLQVGQVLAVNQGKLLEKATKAPSRYTLASLVKALEAEGVGRPATYASIMDNILSRSYVERAGRFLQPTAIGELVVDSLVDNFEFIQLGFTKDLEDDLDRIATGKAAYRAVIQKLYLQLKQEVDTQQQKVPTKVKEVQVFPCPECGKDLRRIPKGANGPFWGCSGHPECSVTLPDNNGKPGQRKVVELSNFACAKCGKPLIHREKKGKGGYDFWGCSGFKEGCKTAYPNIKGKPDYEKAK